MFNIIKYEDVYGNEDNYIFVDVRSPKEFEDSTIEGAINIPVLLDDEREIVGTTYVRDSVEKARSLGIGFISKRLPEIFDKLQKLHSENKGKKIVIFCARGGMRSSSIHSLLNSLGIHVAKLSGGYKAYRAFVVKKLEEYSKEVKLIVLYGNTGVGKTEILYKLKDKGFNIVDLEKAANHRGSILGGVGLGECSTQKKFDSTVYNELRKRNSNVVFTEGESRRIGRILIPECIFDTMAKGEHIYISADISVRAERLVKEYTAFENCKIEIDEALGCLKKHISEENVKYYKHLVEIGEFKEVAKELMKKYYDPMYCCNSKKRNFRESLEINDIEKGILELSRIYNEVLNSYSIMEVACDESNA